MSAVRFPISVRSLGRKDRQVWETLFRGYLEFYQATLPDYMIALTWDRLMSDDPACHIGLVAVDEDDKPIGLAHLLFHRSTWSPSFYCYLEDLFVAPERRSRGAGRALIAAAYIEADKRRCTRTYWSTQKFNHDARALYDQVATESAFVQYRR
ncbi:MAG: GNAT family N-acetyltransferase [Hyphomicrobiaceae bacterium]